MSVPLYHPNPRKLYNFLLPYFNPLPVPSIFHPYIPCGYSSLCYVLKLLSNPYCKSPRRNLCGLKHRLRFFYNPNSPLRSNYLRNLHLSHFLVSTFLLCPLTTKRPFRYKSLVSYGPNKYGHNGPLFFYNLLLINISFHQCLLLYRFYFLLIFLRYLLF